MSRPRDWKAAAEAKRTGAPPEPIPCECGGTPIIVRVRDSALGLRVVGCPACHFTGPASMDTNRAIDKWNAGHRNNPDGERVTEAAPDAAPEGEAAFAKVRAVADGRGEG